jgi:hypothetical protein
MNIIEALEERYAEINRRAQLYSLNSPHSYTRLRIDAEREGAREMLEAAKEAAKDEKNKVPMRAVISHFLCTGEVIPGYEDSFPRFEAQPRIFAPAELRHRSATLGTNKR